MLEQFLEKGKEKWNKHAKEILIELEEEYNRFWEELMNELTKSKLSLEKEVENLTIRKDKLFQEIESNSREALQLSEGIKVLKDNIQKYEIKKNEMLNKIMETENKEKSLQIKENEMLKREEEIALREEKLRIESVQLEERQKRIKKFLDKTA